MSARTVITVCLALVCALPVSAAAQTAPPADPAPPVASGEQSRMWAVIGGTSTTLRGDCQEDCAAHGTGDYLQTGSIKTLVGTRVNKQMDAGLEVSWIAANDSVGDDLRFIFLMAASQFRPWASRGLFLNAGMGMAFVRNFAFSEAGTLPPVTSKALALTYGVGWTFRHTDRLAFQIFGAQHMAALGDFTVGGVTSENVVANFWSVGAAIVIR